MLAHPVPPLLQHVRRLAAAGSPDEQLLADFLASRSDEAFAALVGRHGPMVLGVCRRVLHDAHAAEDVFQATFLVLAERAAAVRRRAALAGFLHGVAYRLAVRARRRRTQDLPASVADGAAGPPERLAWQEMLAVLDQELNQLSDRCRAPLVLCYLEGRTQDEAARQLGWSLNTLRRRLARARRLLEARLRGRGVTLSAALAGLLAGGAAAVPADLQAATVASAVRPAAGWAVLAPGGRAVSVALWTPGQKAAALVAAAVLSAVVCLAGWLVPADPPAADPPAAGAARAGGERRGPAADPLPAGAAVRLGTARYRHGSPIQTLAVSADGKLAAVASRWEALVPARVFDLTDGRCLYSLPYEPGSGVEAVGVSPDGQIMATRDNEYLCFRAAATGQEVGKFKYLPDSGGSRCPTDWLTFSPDGKYVAATLMGTDVQLIDVATGRTARTFAHDAGVSACVFSADGRWLATGGYGQEGGVYYARLWEVETGKELRRFPIGRERNQPVNALAFSPDGTRLAGGSWGDGRLRLFDVASGKELHEFPKIGAEVQSVAFAPDGRTVAAAAANIHLYDVGTGKERLRIGQRARGLAFRRDGSALTGAVSGSIYCWDAATGRQLTPAAAQDSGVEQILIPGGGRHLFTVDQDGDLHAWDPAGGRPPRRVAGDVGRGAVASPDGRYLAWAVEGVYGGSRVRLYDVAADKILDHLPIVTDDASVEAFLPDGKTIITVDRDATAVRFWDLDTGKERRSFPAYTGPKKAFPVVGYPYANRRVALSPDARTLAVAALDEDRPVGLWDVATGKLASELEVRMTSVSAAAQKALRVDLGGLGGRRRVNGFLSSWNGVAFSPDGRLVVTWSEDPFGGSETDHVSVWDEATGRLLTTLAAGRPVGAGCAAFAPDGRTLATASADGVIRVWEAATWRVRAEFHGHRDRVTALAFGPDGRLFTGGLDTVVLGWDPRPSTTVAGTLAAAWEALDGPDARAAYRAQGRFLADPDEAVPWLAARLSPAARPDPARLKSLVADLGSEEFAVRERAKARLRELWPDAAAALREAAEAAPTLEARLRAAALLREGADAVVPAAELQALRAAEVLEWVGTPEALGVLRRLAGGAAGARLTHAAAAACRRLAARE